MVLTNLGSAQIQSRTDLGVDDAGAMLGSVLEGTVKSSSRKNGCVTLSLKGQTGCQQRTYGMNTDCK